MSRTLSVEGMSCEHCEQTVEDALSGVAGVESAAADSDADAVAVTGDADRSELVSAVKDAGYDVSA